jgi:hypothetical protein
LEFFVSEKTQGAHFPIGYFTKMLSFILKSTLIDLKEPKITKLESEANCFTARFLYEMEPWIFKPFMSYIPKIGEKRSRTE